MCIEKLGYLLEPPANLDYFLSKNVIGGEYQQERPNLFGILNDDTPKIQITPWIMIASVLYGNIKR